ncbi:unnamed protein product [Echinostoma caproni]|uniref:Thyroid adenoma-associated protein homolog n=1 Tax=Echinostoma caproni TaxID=27848 RepID=A0A183A049_9TREM|nr:unnamed protein product [Echinostoma caproni]
MKVLVALIISSPSCPNDSLNLVKQLIMDDFSMSVLFEVTNYWLEEVHAINDLYLFSRLYDEEICAHLCDKLHSTKNIHIKKSITNIIAHSALLDIPLSLCKGKHVLTDEALAILLTKVKLSQKFGVTSTPIELTSISFRSIFQDPSPTRVAKVLYLFCVNAIHVSDEASEKSKQFFIDLPNWTQLCTQTIYIYLRHGVPPSGFLWNLVLASWSDAVSSLLSMGPSKELDRLITPISGCARVQCSIPLSDFSNHILHSFLLRDLAPNQSTSSNAGSETIRNMWYILSIFLTPSDSNLLRSISGSLSALVSDSRYSVAAELGAVLHTAEKLCATLTDIEEVLKFVQQLNRLSESSMDTHVTLLLLRHGFHISANTRDKQCGGSPLKQTCRSCLMTSLTILSERLFSILTESPDSVTESSAYASMDFLVEQYIALMESILKIIIEEGIFDGPSEMDCELRFMRILRKLVQSSATSCSVVFCRNDIRMLLACTLSHCFVSVISKQLPLLSDENQLAVKQTGETFTELLNFDMTELLCLPYSRNALIKAQEKLNQMELRSCPTHLMSVVQLLNKGFDRAIHFIDDMEHNSTPTSSCPLCGEMIDQLIQDIMVAHPGVVIADCTEG